MKVSRKKMAQARAEKEFGAPGIPAPEEVRRMEPEPEKPKRIRRNRSILCTIRASAWINGKREHVVTSWTKCGIEAGLRRVKEIRVKDKDISEIEEIKLVRPHPDGHTSYYAFNFRGQPGVVGLVSGEMVEPKCDCLNRYVWTEGGE